jgi:hypothetical protein
MGGVLAGIEQDLPNTALPEDVQAKILRDNAKNLSQTLKKTGITELFPQIIATSATTIGTAAYVDLPGVPIAFVVTGGWTTLEAYLSLETGAANSFFSVKMILDGAVVDQSALESGASNPRGRIVLSYKAFITPGKHTLTVQAATTTVDGTYTPQATIPTNSIIRGYEIVL